MFKKLFYVQWLQNIDDENSIMTKKCHCVALIDLQGTAHESFIVWRYLYDLMYMEGIRHSENMCTWYH